MASLVSQLTELGSLFSGIAGVDPVSTAMLVLGAILILGSIAIVGYLAAGAVADMIIPDRIGRTRRPEA